MTMQNLPASCSASAIECMEHGKQGRKRAVSLRPRRQAQARGGATLPLSAHQGLPWRAITATWRPGTWPPHESGGRPTLHCAMGRISLQQTFATLLSSAPLVLASHPCPLQQPTRRPAPTMPSVLHTIRRMTRDDVRASPNAGRAGSKRHGWIGPPRSPSRASRSFSRGLSPASPDEQPEHDDAAYSFFGTPRIASSCRCSECWATPLAAHCPAAVAAPVDNRKVRPFSVSFQNSAPWFPRQKLTSAAPISPDEAQAGPEARHRRARRHARGVPVPATGRSRTLRDPRVALLAVPGLARRVRRGRRGRRAAAARHPAPGAREGRRHARQAVRGRRAAGAGALRARLRRRA